MLRTGRSLLWLPALSLGLLLCLPAGATRVSIDAMEVTQGLQALESEPIPLIAGRQIAVRIYLYCYERDLAVRGWLEAENADGDLLYLNSEAPSRACSTKCESCSGGEPALLERRNNASLSLNFLIRSDWVQEGSLRLRLQQLEESSTGELLEWSGPGERILPIERDVPLRLAVLSLGKNPPQEAEMQQAESWLQQAFPSGELLVSKRPLTSSDPSRDDSCVTINTLILAARNMDLAAGTDARTHYYGMFDPVGGPNRGCALGIPDPAGRDPDPPPPVASGLNRADGDDASSPGKYAGHEIAHTFGAHHFCSPQEGPCCDPTKKREPLLGDVGDFVGWNFGDAGRGRSPEALAGNDWSDIMTYHPRRWVGSDTLRLLRGRLRQENELRALDLSKVRLPWGLFVSPPTDYLNLVGSNKAKFFYMTPLSLAPVAPGTSKGLSVNVRDAQLKTWRKAHEAWGRAYESRCSREVYFDILIPMSPRVTEIELQWNKGRPVHFDIRPKNLWVKEICLAPENPHKPSSRLALVWKGTANVQYSVQQSRDGGAWETIAVGLLAKHLPLNEAIAPGGDTQFRIAVTDGINSMMAEAPAVRCGAAPLH